MYYYFLNEIRLDHGTIIRTGIIYKKIHCYMRDSASGGLLLKMLTHFEVMLNIFEFPHVKEIVESIVSRFHPIMFLDRDIKTKLVPGSFSYFLREK